MFFSPFQMCHLQFVDIVYVGSINTAHVEHCKMMLNAGKHVLCEKPLAMNTREVKEIVELAKEKKLFLMEVGLQ